MGRPPEIPRDALHRILWRRTDRHGRITFTQQEMAESLLISEYHFSRIMREGERTGRWKVVIKSKHSVKTLAVEDPDVWKARQHA